MFKVRYSHITHDERGHRQVALGVLWTEASDKQDARERARDELRAEGVDAVMIRSVHDTTIGG